MVPRRQVQRIPVLSGQLHVTGSADMDLLHATDILLVPGSGFDWPEPNHFRIVMLPDVDKLKSAMRKMGAFLDGYTQEP